MKEQSLIEMKNKVEAIIRVLQQLMDEQKHLTTLTVGLLEAVKLMPGYEDAIKTLTDRAKENLEAKEKISNELEFVAKNAEIADNLIVN
jgi:hypothetical protein